MNIEQKLKEILETIEVTYYDSGKIERSNLINSTLDEGKLIMDFIEKLKPIIEEVRKKEREIIQKEIEVYQMECNHNYSQEDGYCHNCFDKRLEIGNLLKHLNHYKYESKKGE